MITPLSLAKPGQTVKVEWLDHDRGMTQRLLDLGFVPGATVTCVLKRSRGGIAAYLVRNAVIALRREDAAMILVKEIVKAKEEGA